MVIFGFFFLSFLKVMEAASMLKELWILLDEQELEFNLIYISLLV